MPPAKYDAATKTRALAIYVERGPRDAAAETGVPVGTISSWAKRAGLQSQAGENLAAAVEARSLRLELKRSELAERMYDESAKLLDQLWRPTTYFKIVTVGTGDGTSDVAVGRAEVEQPTFRDQQAIMTSVGIAVDKAQLLSGEATERSEANGGPFDLEAELQAFTRGANAARDTKARKR